MIRESARLAAVAVAAQSVATTGELLGQSRRDQAPVNVRQGVAVQEAQRWSRAAHHTVDRNLWIAGADVSTVIS